MKATNTFEEKYRELNAAQREAVDTIEGPVMVLAGPGTGKTQVLTMRIAKILKETQLDPWNILCLTFTEAGVTAMRERLVHIIGRTAYQVRIHTFHSFGNDIINEHPQLFALSSDWQALSEIERLELLRGVLDELPAGSPLKPFAQPYLYLPDVIKNIQQLKQEDIAADQFDAVLDKIAAFVDSATGAVEKFTALKAKERTAAVADATAQAVLEAARAQDLPSSLVKYLERIYERYQTRLQDVESPRAEGPMRTAFKNELSGWFRKIKQQLPKQRDLCRAYRRYQERLKELGRYDYEDMILGVVREFKRQDELLAEYQERFQYILVDEYQDTNGAQNEIIKLLGSFDDQPNLFVVGDDKQSIYRFQGASLSNMLDFFTTYQASVKVVSLTANYRSQPKVLSAAQALINYNRELLSKYIKGASEDLVSAKKLPVQNLRLLTLATDSDEAAAVAGETKKLIAQGVAPSEIAVLVRYNRDLPVFLEALQAVEVPVRIEGGENVLADKKIQQLLTLLAYVSDVSREDRLAEILLFDWLKLPELASLQLIHAAGSRRESLFRLLQNETVLSELKITKEPFRNLLKQIAQWHKASQNLALPHFVHQVLNESGWLAGVMNEPDAVMALRKLNTLLTEAKVLAQSERGLKLSDFVTRLAALSEHHMSLTCETWPYAVAAVRLMTAHKAKGLEYEYVFIVRANDKHWGNNREPSKLSLPAGFVRYDYVVARENNEDERRLFYVALTRAKRQVVITRAQANDKGRSQAESSFLKELPADDVLVAENLGDEAARDLAVLKSKRSNDTSLEVAAWLNKILERYVLSVTHLNNYLACPRRFYVMNVLRVPSVMTPSQALGTAVHAALDAYYRENWRQLEVPEALLALTRRFKQRLERAILTPAELKETETWGEQIITGYFNQYHESMRRPALVEYDFASQQVRLDDIPLTGKIDKITLAEEAAAEPAVWPKGAAVLVTDYKTGNPDNGLAKLRPGQDYHRQLVFYKLLCEAAPQFPYRMAAGEVDFVQPGKASGEYLKQSIEISDADVTELKETIRQVWSEILALNFITGKERPFCGKCEYCAQ